MFLENEDNTIIGFYENSILNNDKDDSNVNMSPYASFICENIILKKNKYPIVLEIFSRDGNEKDERRVSEVVIQVR